MSTIQKHLPSKATTFDRVALAGKIAAVAVALLYIYAALAGGINPPQTAAEKVAVAYVFVAPVCIIAGYGLAAAASRVAGKDIPRMKAGYIWLGTSTLMAGGWLLLIDLGVL